MELEKQSLRMTHNKGKATTQCTLDDDFNVPDIKPDMERILMQKGTVIIEAVRVLEGRIAVKGKLVFSILYGENGKESDVHNMKGEIPFEEILNQDGVAEGDDVQVMWDVEDLNISLINSRKISVKAVLTITITIDEMLNTEVGKELYGEPDLQYTTKRISMTPMIVKTKDTYRIKDEIELSGNKPNIAQILWSDAQLRSMDIRPMEDKLQLRGELLLFALYLGEDENSSMQWIEQTVPINGSMDVHGCREDVIPDIVWRLSGNDIEAKPDYDGEQRMLGIDYVIDMDIRLYDDTQEEVLSDVYSSMKNLEPVTQKIPLEHLVLKNSSKCKVADKLKLMQGRPRILQIVNCTGSVKVDNVDIIDDGMLIDGLVNISILYMALDDKHPMQSLEGMLPFTHKLEVPGIQLDSIWRLRPSLEQLGAVMLNSDEIELKAAIALDCLIFNQTEEELITEVNAAPYDYKEIERLPGLVGYIVKKDDSLWKIAKKFYTTVDSIKTINDLKDERIKAGDRLVLMKKVEEL